MKQKLSSIHHTTRPDLRFTDVPLLLYQAAAVVMEAGYPGKWGCLAVEKTTEAVSHAKDRSIRD